MGKSIISNLKCLIVGFLISAFMVSTAGCYKTVPVKPPEEKWWEEGKTWIKASGHERWIKVKEVKADSVYGELDLGLSRPSYKSVVVPLQAVQQVKRKKLDPAMSVFGFALVTGFIVGAIFIVSYSKIELD